MATPDGTSRRGRRQHQPGLAGLRADLANGLRHLGTRTSGQHKRFVLAVVALGTLLRILRLDAPLSFDEAYTWTAYAGRSFAFLFSDYTFTGNHILYSALARVSTLIFGVHPWSLRLPALVAGVLVMPLAYSFARKVFNRHIAVIFLCFLAVSGPLVEYSAMARGYSLMWLAMWGMLATGRHYVKTENWASAVLMAVIAALGMWATPAMAYAAIMAYAWTWFMVLSNYESTVRRRTAKLLGSLVLAGLLSVLCYLPVIVAHSVDHLINHPSMVDNTWARFVNTQQDRVFEVWAYFSDSSSTLLAVAGMVSVVYAANVSSKYRFLIFGLLLGAVPLILLQRFLAPPATWVFTLAIFGLGIAIALFYLLKLVRDKLYTGFGKPQRTLVAGGAVLLLFGVTGLRSPGDLVERFPDARLAAQWLAANTAPGDRVCVQSPWSAPVGFYLTAYHAPASLTDGVPTGKLLVLVAPGHGQTPSGVLRDAGIAAADNAVLQDLRSWGRLELFGVETP